MSTITLVPQPGIPFHVRSLNSNSLPLKVSNVCCGAGGGPSGEESLLQDRKMAGQITKAKNETFTNLFITIKFQINGSID